MSWVLLYLCVGAAVLGSLLFMAGHRLLAVRFFVASVALLLLALAMVRTNRVRL